MDNEKEVLRQEKNNTGVCAFLGTFPPKECGIATFTKDLVTSITKESKSFVPKIVAVSENGSSYDYGKEVVLKMNRDDIKDYKKIAEEINLNDDIKLVCIQHEYGIFGGMDGKYLRNFFEVIRKPVIITFHSVIPEPDESIEKITKFITSKAAAIIVMAKEAINILKRDYGVDESKIHVIHHGIPTVEFQNSSLMKEKLNLKDRIVLSTFGLLNEEKGIEYMIKSLPSLVKEYPKILYQIIGETHPMARKEEGESYRERLMVLVKDLGLEDNVVFQNRFLTLQEILDNLLATDIYIFTNLDENQISSGTLSYALGCGRAIVATPVTYAKEILSDGKGVLVDFRDPKSFARAIRNILADSGQKEKMEIESYQFSRQMIWQNVATKYLSLFEKVFSTGKTINQAPLIALA